MTITTSLRIFILLWVVFVFGSACVSERSRPLDPEAMDSWYGESHECDVDAYFTFKSRVDGDFLIVKAKATTSNPQWIDPGRVEMIFDHEQTMPKSEPGKSKSLLLQNDWSEIWIPFHGRSAFENGNSIEAEIPVLDATGTSTCLIHATLNRNATPFNSDRTRRARTDHFTSRFDLGFQIGGPLYRTSGFSQLGTSSLGFGLQGTYFFTPHSGVSLLLKAESTGDGNTSTYQALSGNTVQGYLSLSEFAFAALYSYRFFPHSHWDLTYSGGPAAYLATLDDSSFSCDVFGNCYGNSYGSASEWKFGLEQQLAVDYRFGGWSFGGLSSQGVGLEVYDFWLPALSGGQSLGILFRYTVGW